LGIENLNSFFNPKNIAVIGASERKTSLGGLIFSNLKDSFNGQVFPVNEWHQTVQGIKAYPTIARIPIKVDLAIVATPAHTVPQILEGCGKIGVQGVIIVSAGFDENYSTGQQLIKQLTELCKTYGTRIIGPNSLGVIRPKNNLYATFGDKKAIPGKIAFISQSAALCGTVLDWSQETKVGLSAVVSLGRMIDVELSDLIEFFGTDPQTRAIMLYIESIKNIRAFMSAAREYARIKPIIIVKSGKFHKNPEITVNHELQITEDFIYDAAFKRVGIVRVETIDELFDCAKALSMQPNPPKPNLTMISNADGPAVLAADQLIMRGGHLSTISESALTGLKTILPHYCNITNPIDLLEEATPERFRDTMQICLSDPTGESILLIYSPQGVTKPHSIAQIVSSLAEDTKRTLLVTLMGEDQECQEARKTLHLNSIPTFKTPEEAVAAFMNMYSCTRNLELLYQTPQEIQLNQNKPTYIKKKIMKAIKEGRSSLNVCESLSLLKSYKIPVKKIKIASNTKEVADSDFSKIRLTESKPKQIDGLKLFLGSKKHTKFGPLIILGRIFEDLGEIGTIAVGFPPLNQILAKQLIETAKLTHPYKAATSIDTAVLEQTLVRFSQLLLDFPDIEININPLAIKGSKIKAYEANVSFDMNKIIREDTDQSDELVIAPYPKKYISKQILRDGSKVTFRPIKPEDEPKFNKLFMSLSQQSVRFRFFQVIKELSHDTLAQYCNLDYNREIAIISEHENGQIIGAVTLIIEPNRKKAEYAIMISDAWQGLGLGSKLMDYIIGIAQDFEITSLYGIVSSANKKMLSLCERIGFETKLTDEETVETTLTISNK
jgi:acetyltransferase